MRNTWGREVCVGRGGRVISWSAGHRAFLGLSHGVCSSPGLPQFYTDLRTAPAHLSPLVSLPLPYHRVPKRVLGEGQFGHWCCRGQSLSNSHAVAHISKGVPTKHYPLCSDLPGLTLGLTPGTKGLSHTQGGEGRGPHKPALCLAFASSVFLQRVQLTEPRSVRGKRWRRGGGAGDY